MVVKKVVFALFSDRTSFCITEERLTIAFFYLFNGASQMAQWLKKKNMPANMFSLPGSGRSHGIGTGNPLQYFQYSCLEKSKDKEVCGLQSVEVPEGLDIT